MGSISVSRGISQFCGTGIPFRMMAGATSAYSSPSSTPLGSASFAHGPRAENGSPGQLEELKNVVSSQPQNSTKSLVQSLSSGTHVPGRLASQLAPSQTLLRQFAPVKHAAPSGRPPLRLLSVPRSCPPGDPPGPCPAARSETTGAALGGTCMGLCAGHAACAKENATTQTRKRTETYMSLF